MNSDSASAARRVGEYQIPDLSGLRRRTAMHGLNYMLRGGGPQNEKARGLAVSLIRLYDLALNSYEQGRQSLLELGKPTSAVRFGLFVSASGYFEVCVDALKRAINHVKALRAAPFIPQSLKDLIPRGTPLLSGAVEGRVSGMRHALQHLEGGITKGEVGENESFVLYPAEEGVEVAGLKILYTDLARWINALAEICERIAQFHEQGSSNREGPSGN